MAKYITPTLTITSNAYDATTNPGPTTSPVAISVTDLLDVTEVSSKLIAVGTTDAVLFTATDEDRLMTLKPGEFAFFPWDLEANLHVDASAAVDGALEAIVFVRTGTA